LVVSVNPGQLLHPIVLLYDASVPREEAIMLDMNEDPELTVARTLHPSALTREVHDYLSPRSRISYYADAAPTPR
jgi:hypothetical protein